MKQGELLMYIGRIKRRELCSGGDFEVVTDLSPYDIEMALITSARKEEHRFEIYKEDRGFYADAFDTSLKATTYTLEVSMLIEGVQVVAKNTYTVKVESSVLGKNIGITLTQPTPQPSTPDKGTIESGVWEYIIELTRTGSEAEINGWSDGCEALKFVLGTVLKGGDGDGSGGGGKDGNGIESVTLLSTEGLVKTYKILFTNGESTTFDVTDGKDGKDGLDGVSGQDGADGIQGEKGDTGEQGIQGEKGDTGEQGIQGEKGDTGEQGIQGEKGDTGADGANGVDGQDGADGADAVEMTQIIDGSTTITLANNTEYLFTTELESLDISLPDDWGVSDFAVLRFLSGDTVTALTVSTWVKPSGEAEANSIITMTMYGEVLTIQNVSND